MTTLTTQLEALEKGGFSSEEISAWKQDKILTLENAIEKLEKDCKDYQIIENELRQTCADLQIDNNLLKREAYYLNK